MTKFKYILLVGAAFAPFFAGQIQAAGFDQSRYSIEKSCSNSSDCKQYSDDIVESGTYIYVKNTGSSSSNIELDNVIVDAGGGIKINSQTPPHRIGTIMIENGGAFEFYSRSIINEIDIYDNTIGDYVTGTIANGVANNILVTANSSLIINSDEQAVNTDVRYNGKLLAYGGSTIENLKAANGSEIALSKTSTIQGDLLLAGGAVITDASGNIIYNNSTDAADLTANVKNLTLTGSVNNYFKTEIKTNESNASLTMDNGSFDFDGLAFSGWKTGTITDSATAENMQISFKLDNNGYISGSVINSGGVLNMKDSSMGDSIEVEEGGLLNQTGEDSQLDTVFVYEGGTFNIAPTTGNAIAENVDVASGGTFRASGGAMISNITFGGKADDANDNAKFHISTSDDMLIDGITFYDKAKHGSITGNAVENFVVGKGSLLVVNNGTLNGSWIYGEVEANGTKIAETSNNVIFDGGVLALKNGSSIKDIKVEEGGSLFMSADSKIIENGSIDINKNSTLGGYNGSVFDYSEIAKKAKNLTLSGGINDVLNGRLEADKTRQSVLFLDEGDFDAAAGNIKNWYTVAVGNSILDNYTAEAGTYLLTDTSKLSNLTIADTAQAIIDSASHFVGNLTIYKDADLTNSTYNWSDLANDADLSGITLVGGLNSTIENVGLNTTAGDDRSLTLKDGSYAISDASGTAGILGLSGWKYVYIQGDGTAVKLEGDLRVDNFYVGGGTTFDISGHSPLVSTIYGNVFNDGTITALDGSTEADDRITITGNYTAGTGAVLKLDVDALNNLADMLVIEGDVIGTTGLELKFVSQDENSAPIQIVKAENDDETTAADFVISSVDGSPFAWYSKKQADGWYINFDRQVVLGEVGGYIGLLSASFEQTRNMTQNIKSKVYATRGYNKLMAEKFKKNYNCCDDAAYNVWVAPVYSNPKVKAPFEFEAEISGLEAGVDLLSKPHHKIGVFASYRKGKYAFTGDGKKYKMESKADVTIDSYLLGLYYNWHRNEVWGFATVYGGEQRADVSARNRVKADADALELGANVELGYTYAVNDKYNVEPSIRAEYTMLNYENIKDNAGKKADYHLASQTEIEAGVKLQRVWELDGGAAEIYIKPAVVQTITTGNNVTLTGMGKVKSLENETLGRASVGGGYNVTKDLTIKSDVVYTYNHNYEDASINFGVNYAF